MRRALAIAGWTLGSLLALLLVLLAGVLVAGNTAAGRHLLERTVAGVTAGHVRLAGLAGSFPSDLQLRQLQVSDARGPWLSAANITLRWSPLSLLARHVRIERLELDTLTIARMPVATPAARRSSTPSVPHVDLDHLVIHTLQLGTELAGAEVSLAVSVDAHVRSLREASVHASASRSGGQGQYVLALNCDAQRLDAQLRLSETANGPLENILKIPGLGALSVQASLAGPRNAEVIDVTLDAGALHGQARGTADLATRSAQLTYALDAPAMAPAPGLSWQAISLHGEWHGPPQELNATGQLQVRGLRLPAGAGLGSLTADLRSVQGRLTARATLQQLVIPGPDPALLRAAPVTLDANVDLKQAARPLHLTATHPLFALRADARTNGKRSATLQLELPELKPLAALGHQDVAGSATLQGEVSDDSGATKLAARLDARIDGGAAAWAGLLHGSSHLRMSGRISDRSYTLDELAVDADQVTASASGSLARGSSQKVSARATLELADLRRLPADAAGSLRLRGDIDGTLQDLSATVDLDTMLSVHGSPPGELTGSVKAHGLPHAPRVTLALQGRLDDAPLHLQAALEERANHAFRVDISHADWKSAHAEGEISGGADLAQPHGRLALRMTQLADLDRLLGTNLHGSVDGTLAVSSDRGGSRAELQLEARNAGIGALGVDARLAGSGPLDALDLAFSAQSPAIAGKPARVAANSVLDLSSRTLRIAAANLEVYGQQLTLAQPATLSFGDGLAVTALRLQAQGATLTVEGRVTPALDLKATLRDVQPKLVNAFAGNVLAAGSINGDATLSGSPARPMGQLHLQALGMRAASGIADGLPAADLRVSAQLLGDTAQLDARLAAGARSQLALSGRAPLAATGALDLKLTGALDANMLNPLLEAGGRHVSGELNLDTAIGGTAGDPQVRGTMHLAQGTFRDYTQGVQLTDVTADAEGTEKSLRIVKLTARAEPGTISMTGSIDILAPGMPVDIQLVAKNARPVTSSILTANLDASLHVSGTARRQLDVGGTIDVNRADISIPSSFPPSVAVLDVRRPGQAPPAPAARPLEVGLDIRVRAPRQILVRGRGLDAELGGELRIGGTAADPRVTGGFDLQRGTFDIASSRLNFTRGSVAFNGAGLQHKLDPTLDFTAQATLADATATVRITGFADAPKITLSSTPDMPQDEILARLLFGVPAAQLTALQVVQIGAALATLGGGGGLNPVAAIQKTLGLDRLSISGGAGSTGTGTGAGAGGEQPAAATVEAGKYISSRVFVAVKQSTTGSSQVALDVDLTKHLKLQTRLGNGTATTQGTTPENDPGSSVGLAYTFEY
ncbi:MAG TPA: translocation/assembly module TamB domain-containing protein [Steroidobacteraceae bacterium]|nr:translocation/assembly module TamB domain-containing protein [Steroidobacteraceae bacterium]